METYVSIIRADNMTAANITKTLKELGTPAELISEQNGEILINVPDGVRFGYSLNSLRQAVSPASVKMFGREYTEDGEEIRYYAH